MSNTDQYSIESCNCSALMYALETSFKQHIWDLSVLSAASQYGEQEGWETATVIL